MIEHKISARPTESEHAGQLTDRNGFGKWIAFPRSATSATCSADTAFSSLAIAHSNPHVRSSNSPSWCFEQFVERLTNDWDHRGRLLGSPPR
jgi:hypothetical protein